MITKTKEKIKELYLDYVNNFLTIEYFAEFYNMPINKVKQIIKISKKMGV